jgi:hypothetical protein
VNLSFSLVAFSQQGHWIHIILWSVLIKFEQFLIGFDRFFGENCQIRWVSIFMGRPTFVTLEGAHHFSGNFQHDEVKKVDSRDSDIWWSCEHRKKSFLFDPF